MAFSRELRPLIAYARRFDIPIIAIVSKLNSPLAKAANIVLPLPQAAEACPARIAPTTSTTMMLALGDALAIGTMARRGITRTEMAMWHPGGAIGSRLAPIEEIIDLDEPMPLVRADAPMREVVFEMTSGGKGVAAVINKAGALIGVITDGDLRRAFDQVLTARARDIMTPAPVTVPRGAPVEEVLALMNARKITVLFVTEADDPTRPIGGRAYSRPRPLTALAASDASQIMTEPNGFARLAAAPGSTGVATIVIPTRYASTRFPAKALAPIRGSDGTTRTLVEWCYEAAKGVTGVARIYVATDDERIAGAVAGFGGEALMTPVSCANGTERIAACLDQLPGTDLLVNLQGDALLTPRLSSRR